MLKTKLYCLEGILMDEIESTIIMLMKNLVKERELFIPRPRAILGRLLAEKMSIK